MSNYSCILIGSRLSSIWVQTLNLLSFLYHGKQEGSMLPRVWSVLDHRGRQNVLRTSVKHSIIASCATVLFSAVFTSSVIYYWPDTQLHGVFLFIFHSLSTINFSTSVGWRPVQRMSKWMLRNKTLPSWRNVPRDLWRKEGTIYLLLQAWVHRKILWNS